MSDFIRDCPKIVLDRIWSKLRTPQKEQFCHVYSDLQTDFPKIGAEFHCCLCILREIIETFSSDDGKILPKHFLYKNGLNLNFTNGYYLRTWKIRRLFDPNDSKVPTAIFNYFLSQLDRICTFENIQELETHIKVYHESYLIWNPINDKKPTNFINNHIEVFPEDTAQADFLKFYLSKMTFFMNHRINWDKIEIDGDKLDSYRAVRMLAYFLNQIKNDDENQIGGKTSKNDFNN